MDGSYNLFQTGVTWAAVSALLFVLIKVIIIIALGIAAIKIADKFVDLFVIKKNTKKDDAALKKSITLANIFKSIIKWFVYFIIIMSVLSEFGMGTAASSLIATAGVGGLALTFGAQNLVKDMVTGGFMLYEDQYKIGDYVKVAGVEGYVEHVSLRVTTIRSPKGELFFVPNGQVNIVTNLSRVNYNAMVEVGVSYSTSINKAIESMERAGKVFSQQVDYMAGEPKILGVTKLGDYYVAIKMLCPVKPMHQFEAERTLLKLVKEQFEQDGIEIPFPTYLIKEEAKEEKNG